VARQGSCWRNLRKAYNGVPIVKACIELRKFFSNFCSFCMLWTRLTKPRCWTFCSATAIYTTKRIMTTQGYRKTPTSNCTTSADIYQITVCPPHPSTSPHHLTRYSSHNRLPLFPRHSHYIQRCVIFGFGVVEYKGWEMGNTPVTSRSIMAELYMACYDTRSIGRWSLSAYVF
jgi:hypothetical protein